MDSMLKFYIIPVILDIHGHRFEIYALLSEIHENIDLVLSIKNIFELVGVINSWDCCFNFLNRSIPNFPKEHIVLKSKEQRLIKVEAPFIDEISRLAVIKVLDKKAQSMMMLKLKFTWNSASLDITNSGSDTIIYNPKEMIGTWYLRSLGYYKNKARYIAANLSTYYKFESADTLCKQFNKFYKYIKERKKRRDRRTRSVVRSQQWKKIYDR